ncbi:MAG: 2-oxoacid:acceptor oxidoreductase family protein [Nanoarchaeota archaeon]|nr:2-oxoacid:acceptor oxidoreductase family protein [Nanoarchaeota archaeon]MCG2718109.1 2-oxoacid:acceptor oxidoreductase family protein [Nanoarchaeota archaeon]
MNKKIKLVGTGGQGIKLLGHVLGNVLSEIDYNVSLNFEFDTSVRGGNISADLIYSDEPIENPVIEKADILLQLGGKQSDTVKIKATEKIVEKNICNQECTKCDLKCENGKQIPFYDVANKKFGSKIYMNMLAIGIILKHIGVDITKVNLKKGLPERFIEQNIEAIKYGYSFSD